MAETKIIERIGPVVMSHIDIIKDAILHLPKTKMHRQEERVLAALNALGGEADSIDIHQRILETSWFGNTGLGFLLVSTPCFALIRLERKGILTRRWSGPRADRGGKRTWLFRLAK